MSRYVIHANDHVKELRKHIRLQPLRSYPWTSGNLLGHLLIKINTSEHIIYLSPGPPECLQIVVFYLQVSKYPVLGLFPLLGRIFGAFIDEI